MFLFKKNRGTNAVNCIINGKKENLEKIQRMLDSGKESKLNIAEVMVNEYKIERKTARMFVEYAFENGIPADFDEVRRQNGLDIQPRKHLKEGKNHGYCIINGKVENLENVQELLDYGEDVSFEIAKIMMDEYKMDGVTAVFFGRYVNKNGIPTNFDEVKKQNDLEIAKRPSCRTSGQPQCPYCHSTNVRKVVGAGRTPFRRYRCHTCGGVFH